ncbi:MAG: PepSY domain-containing protein [Flavobacteriales bacterium]
MLKFRKVHRVIAIIAGFWLLVVASTGLMLGWKKTVGNPLQAPNEKGLTDNLTEWLPLGELKLIADSTVLSHKPEAKTASFKIDIRSKFTIVKFIYSKDFKEVQVDGATGKVLAVNHRNGDLIEKIHEGEIFDMAFGSGSFFKHFLVSLGSLSLLTLGISGLWLWFEPVMRRRAQRKEMNS